jgi:hypothetical protein
MPSPNHQPGSDDAARSSSGAADVDAQDQALQDYLDRAHLGASSASTAERPADADPDDLAAYRVLYEALDQEPDGPALPADFAEQVADRVMPAPDTARVPLMQRLAWLEELLFPALVVLAFLATFFGAPLVVDLTVGVMEGWGDAMSDWVPILHLDLLAAIGTGALLIAALDRALARWRLRRRPSTG